MKRKIKDIPVIHRETNHLGQVRERVVWHGVWKSLGPSGDFEPEGNTIGLDEIPPLDAEGHIWRREGNVKFRGSRGERFS